MSLKAGTIQAAEQLLARLPAVSRPIIERYFRQNPAVDHKADDSPVTLADKEVEAALRAVIASQFSDHAIIGEEHGGQPDKPCCWVIDPIDGTRAFITGKPLFGTLVAFVHEGQPVCSVIDMPALDETYLTAQGRACLITSDGRSGDLQTRSCAKLADAHLATTSPEAFTPQGWQSFQAVSQLCRSAHYGGDCYNYALLAAGHLDLVIEHQLAPHDLMALVPVLQGAGAVVTDWQGRAPVLGGDGSLVAACGPELHAQALTMLAQTDSLAADKHHP